MSPSDERSTTGRLLTARSARSGKLHTSRVALVDALERLHRKAALWLVEEIGLEPVVRAACDALAAGLSGHRLTALATLSVHVRESVEVDELVFGALEEQGRPLPARDSTTSQQVALVVMAAEVVEGQRAPRELAAWAHRRVGHDGARTAPAEALVLLDDEYDCLEYTKRRKQDLDAEGLAHCRALIADDHIA